MADIKIEDITNSTTTTDGTGIFDKLIRAVELHITSQYDSGRITGTDYATVYLGAIQAIIQQSIAFSLEEQQAGNKADLIASQVLSENKNNEVGGLIDLQKIKISEDTSLSSAQIAKTYEDIASSKSSTIRSVTSAALSDGLIKEKTESENKQNEVDGVIDKQKLDIIQATFLKAAQVLEIPLESTRKDNINAEQVTSSIASTVRSDTDSTKKNLLLQEQIESEAIKNDPINGVLIKERLLADEAITESQEKIDLLQSQDSELLLNGIKDRLIKDSQVASSAIKDSLVSKQELEVVASTSRNDLLSTSKISTDTESITSSASRTIRDDSMNTEKELLVKAQTLGFASDTKQKVLKQMFENYAVNLSIAGVGNFPEAGQDGAIDHLVADILGEVGVTNIINTDTPVDLKTATTPATT